MILKTKVKAVLSDTVIKIEDSWNFRGVKGGLVKINGLRSADEDMKETSKKELEELILNKPIEICDFLYRSKNILNALVKFDGEYLQNKFPDRAIFSPSQTRWLDADESMIIKKVSGGLPITFQNPISKVELANERLIPYLGNKDFPHRPYTPDFKKELKFVNRLFSDTHKNKKEMDLLFKKFLTIGRDGALLLYGDVGSGKSWWVRRKLMNLPSEHYNSIIIDLRYINDSSRARLEADIENEVNEFLNYYIKDLSWLYPDFYSIYGTKFNSDDEEIYNKMIDHALRLSTEPYIYIKKRLRYFTPKDKPALIIFFDNIDHFDAIHQTTVVDWCYKLIGNYHKIKLIFAIRPQTEIKMGRVGKTLGEAIHSTIHLNSPDIYDVLKRRLSINSHGEQIDLKNNIPSTNITWYSLLHKFIESNPYWGSMRLLIDLCSTQPIFNLKADKNSPMEYKTFYQIDYDVRHFIRLFRRLIKSDCLGSLLNIDKTYFAIHALMLKAGEPLEQGTAYLLNFFDNEKPNLKGNALIRYRVLEYFAEREELGEPFYLYIESLGLQIEEALALCDLYEKIGLMTIKRNEISDIKKIPVYGYLTIAGDRHLELIYNMWYIICIKTGMNIYADAILTGKRASEEANKFVKSPKILEYYSNHGWVSEKNFLNFIGSQEILESKRIGLYQENLDDDERDTILDNLTANRTKLSEALHWAIEEQLDRWAKYTKNPLPSEVNNEKL